MNYLGGILTIEKIEIINLLSFDELILNDLNDMNCIVGRNNVGKSNLFKALKYFYNRLENKVEIPPRLNSNYSYKGSIAITFDTTRIHRIARKHSNNKYFRFIISKLIPIEKRSIFSSLEYNQDKTAYTLTLNIYSDGKVAWSTNDRHVLNLIFYLYPFFHIEPRHMDLYEWDGLWDLISRLKSFNLSKIDDSAVIDFFDKSINSGDSSSYKQYIEELSKTISTKPSTPKEKVLSYIKAGLKGYRFEIDENDLRFHSDGTNSFHFIKTFLKILISISRREYITPFVFIDEPEIGLHPKMNETLVHDIYMSYKYSSLGNDKVPKPRVFLSTHSPNIIKEVVKKFREKQRIFSFQKSRDSTTSVNTLNSTYESESFINSFNDNEARLFFSDFILFVEGETELEVFGNMNLCNHFKHLRDIDVYKSSSNVIGERVNPSYSNSAIPYLFLFDADKAISISGTPNNFNLKLRKNGNYFNFKQDTLNAEYHKFKLGFSQKYKREKENIRYILDNREKNLGIDLTSQTFVNKHEFESIFKAVKHRLLSKKIYINRTTFEGCLIHEASSKIFYDWIKKEYEVDLSQILQRVRNSKRLKESMLIDYLRIIFNGKSQVFTDYSYFNVNGYEQALKKKKKINGKLSHTSRHAKMLMKILEKHIIENNSLGKTNGWATSFLNFAIHDLENKSLVLEKPFGTLFSIHFPEFYDIIQMLRPDSRGKV